MTPRGQKVFHFGHVVVSRIVFRTASGEAEMRVRAMTVKVPLAP